MENTYTDTDHTPAWEVAEIQKCAQSFEYFCENYVKIPHPKKGLTPFHLYPFQNRFVESMETNRFLIGKKFRCGGFSTVEAIYSLWLSMFRQDQVILFVAKTDAEAVEIGDIIRSSIYGFPVWLLPELSRNNQHNLEFADTGSKILFHAPVAARGRAVTHLFLDEPAFWDRAEEFWRSIYPCVSTGGKAIIMSSVKRVKKKEKNWFRDCYKDSAEGKNSFVVFHADYREHPDYENKDWVCDMRARLGEELWKQEVLCEFDEDDDEPQHKPTINLADAKKPFRIYHRDQDGFIDVFSKFEKDMVNVRRSDQDIKDLLARKGFAYTPIDTSNILQTEKNPEDAEVLDLSKKPIDRAYARVVLEKHIMTPPNDPVGHPEFVESLDLDGDDLEELWNNIEEVIPGTKPPMPGPSTSGIEGDMSSDMLRLAGVIPPDVEKGDPAEYCVEWQEPLLQRISEGFPEGLKLSLEESLCVNGVPTKIKTKAIEMAFVGLTELSSFDKALDTVGKLVKKKLKVLF